MHRRDRRGQLVEQRTLARPRAAATSARPRAIHQRVYWSCRACTSCSTWSAGRCASVTTVGFAAVSPAIRLPFAGEITERGVLSVRPISTGGGSHRVGGRGDLDRSAGHLVDGRWVAVQRGTAKPADRAQRAQAAPGSRSGGRRRSARRTPGLRVPRVARMARTRLRASSRPGFGAPPCSRGSWPVHDPLRREV